MPSTLPSIDAASRDAGAAAPLVIVGAGQAGANAARHLRELGYAGELVLIGDEDHAPYERPPLSKVVLAEAAVPDLALLPASFYAEQRIDVRQGRRAARLDVEHRRLELDDGTTLRFQACLLATGGRPRRLALPPDTAGIHYLRTLDEALRLRAAMREADSMLVVGGGFLGLEIASTARAQGLAVTVVEQGPMLLGRSAPPLLSAWIAARAAAYGVNVRVEASLAQLACADPGVQAELTSGTVLRAGLAVVAIGQEPEVSLARAAGLVIDARNGGIVVDARGRTSAPSVYAAGDCASGPCAATAAHVRLESWQNANEQARIAAAAMLGADAAPALPPWFWTDQFGCNIQMLGRGEPGLVYHARGTLPPACDAGKALLFGIRDNRLAHIVAVNAGGDLRAFRNALDRPLACAPGALCDTRIPARRAAMLALGGAPA